MKRINIKTSYKKMLADTTTPVSIYLRLRDIFPNSLLLESSDYHSRANNVSYVCCVPIAGIRLTESELEINYPDGTSATEDAATTNLREDVADFCAQLQPADQAHFKFISNGLIESELEINYPDGTSLTKDAATANLREDVSDFCALFQTDDQPDFKFISNGLFGYFTFDTITHFEDIKLTTPPDAKRDIPFMQYHVYQYVIAIDHFKNELYIFEHTTGDNEPYGLSRIEYLIQNKNFPDYHFALNGPEESNLSDEEFKETVETRS